MERPGVTCHEQSETTEGLLVNIVLKDRYPESRSRLDLVGTCGLEHGDVPLSGAATNKPTRQLVPVDRIADCVLSVVVVRVGTSELKAYRLVILTSLRVFLARSPGCLRERWYPVKLDTKLRDHKGSITIVAPAARTIVWKSLIRECFQTESCHTFHIGLVDDLVGIDLGSITGHKDRLVVELGHRRVTFGQRVDRIEEVPVNRSLGRIIEPGAELYVEMLSTRFTIGEFRKLLVKNCNTHREAKTPHRETSSHILFDTEFDAGSTLKTDRLRSRKRNVSRRPQIGRTPVAGPARLRVVIDCIGDDMLFLRKTLTILRRRSECHGGPLLREVLRVTIDHSRCNANAEVGDDKISVTSTPDESLLLPLTRQDFETKEINLLEQSFDNHDVGVLRRIVTRCDNRLIVFDRECHSLSGCGDSRVGYCPLLLGAERRELGHALGHAACDLGIHLFLTLTDVGIRHPEVRLVGIVKEREELPVLTL